MSLISSLHTAFSGIRTTEAQMSTVSSNVTNADKAGYTKKVYQTDYITASGVTVPSGGITVGSLDKYLVQAVIDDVSDVGYYDTLSSYLDQYADALGTVGSGQGLSAALDNLISDISALETSPDDSSLKANLVNSAEILANTLNTLSDTIQDQRLQASQEIETTVGTINEALNKIDALNKQISVLQAQGASTADLEDERMVALESLASEMDVSYFFSSDNQLKVYTTFGQPLVDSQAHTLSYSSASSVTSQTEYPSGFGAITLNGVDITTQVSGGTLGALIELRDDVLVGEQAKLDEFAQTLAQSINDVLNDGASYPPRSEIVGGTTGIAGTDALSATGTIRWAVTDQSGTVISVNDIDLSAYTTMDDLVSALDAISGVSASLNTSGQLVLQADNGGEYISINQMNSAVGADGAGFGTFFGLNNLFTGTGAENLRVSDAVSENPDYLATGVLSDSATLAVGDRALSAADATTIAALSDMIGGSVSFDAAGGFASQNATLSSYVSKIVSAAATLASNAASESVTAQTLYTQTSTLLSNSTGVNLDEETARMTELQNHYESAAMLISKLQEMFDSLLAAID